ncbi:MAG: hypothetical protein RIQ45_839 [Actinomycetota bacterium]|jgi:hypothetical protein
MHPEIEDLVKHKMLVVSGEKLIYSLSFLEKLGAFRKSPKSLLKNIQEIRYIENPWSREVLRGLRAPGTGIPYVIMLGTMRHRKGKDFCVIYKKNPVILIEFKNEKFARWVIPDTLVNRSLLESIN